MRRENVKRILILRNVRKRQKTVIVTTYVNVGRDAYEFKTPVRFRLTFTEIGSRSCSTEPGPKVEDAGDAESSNEDALILG